MRVARITFVRLCFYERPINIGRRKSSFTLSRIDNNQKIVINCLTNTTHHRDSRRPLGFNISIIDPFVILKRNLAFLPPSQEDTVVETAFRHGESFLNEDVLDDWVCEIYQEG